MMRESERKSNLFQVKQECSPLWCSRLHKRLRYFGVLLLANIFELTR